MPVIRGKCLPINLQARRSQTVNWLIFAVAKKQFPFALYPAARAYENEFDCVSKLAVSKCCHQNYHRLNIWLALVLNGNDSNPYG